MDEKEIRLRAVYLFLTSVKAVDHFMEKLCSHVIELKEGRKTPAFDVLLRQEIALLFRHWAARILWNRLEASETDATRMNQQLLRLFTEGFKLPRDGRGVHYAALLTLEEEGFVFSERMFNTLTLSRKPASTSFHFILQQVCEATTTRAKEALEWPLDRLTKTVESLSKEEVSQ